MALTAERPELPKPDFPIGIKVLYAPEDETDTTVDICFVHGLTGHRLSTWTADGHKPWPKTLLPKILPTARILSFGYDTYFVRSAVSTNGLDQHALSLLQDLVDDRWEAGALGRPLIFVAHSLGGIVCKAAVLKSKNPPADGAHLRDIYESLSAIAFLGTPHRGTAMAGWAKMPVSSLGFFVNSTNDKLLDVLRIGNELNERTKDDFSGARDERRREGNPIRVTCFYEEKAMPFGGPIVDRASASLDDGMPKGITANHRNMVKFKSAEDPGFKRLSAELKRWVGDLASSPKEDDTLKDPSNLQCLRDLCISNPEDDRSRIERTKGGLLKGAYEWIFGNAEFQTFMQEPEKPLLWIRGDPGKGKTMLMCGIINKLKEEKRLLSTFFCQATDERLNSATSVLRGLIYSLVDARPRLISCLRNVYDKKGKDVFEDASAWDVLVRIFKEMCQMCRDGDTPAVVCLVDALDECTTGLADLLQLVTTCSEVRWIVSSRNWLTITEKMRRLKNRVPLQLELNPDAVSQAVETYISFRVDDLAQTKEYDTETKDKVQRYLSEHAQGTFLWVSLVCKVLDDTPGTHETETVLKALPEGLSELYQIMMDTVLKNTVTAPRSVEILKVVTTAFRPLSLQELASLLPKSDDNKHDHSDGNKLDQSDGNKLNHSDGNSLKPLEQSIQVCGSFITLREENVYFVHQSAKDFMVEESAVFQSGIGHHHSNLFSASLTALTNHLGRDIYDIRYPGTLSEDIKRPENDPLAPVRYACLFWAEHLESSSQSQNLETFGVEVRDKELESFLRKAYLHWLEAMSLLRAVPSAIKAMRVAKRLITGQNDNISTLVHDAVEFILENTYIIDAAPLQVYASALFFCSSHNSVRQIYEAGESPWITCRPAIKRKRKLPLTFEGHKSIIQALSISSDGEYFASDSDDTTVKVWNIEDRICVATLKFPKTFKYLSLSSSSNKLLLGTVSTRAVATVWDVSTKTSIHEVTVAIDGTSIRFVCFSSDLRRVTVYYNSEAVVWDIDTGARIRTRSFDNFCDIKGTSPSGQKVVVKIWDTISICDEELKVCHVANYVDNNLYGAALAPDGRLLASATYHATTIYDTTQPAGKNTVQSFPELNYHGGISFSPNGEYVAFVTGPDCIEVWHTATWEMVFRSARSTSSYTKLAFTPDGKRLLAGSLDGRLTIYDIFDPTMDFSRDEKKTGRDYVVVSSDGSRLFKQHGNNMELWNITTGTMMESVSLDDSGVDIVKLVCSPDGSRLLVAMEHAVFFWDTTSTNGLCRIYLPDNFFPWDVLVSRDIKHIAVDIPGALQVFQIDTQHCHPPILGSEIHVSRDSSASLSPDSQRLATINSDSKTAHFCDAMTGTCVAETKLEDGATDICGSAAERVIFIMRDAHVFSKTLVMMWDMTPPAHNETPGDYLASKISAYSRDEYCIKPAALVNYYIISTRQPKITREEGISGVDEDGWIKFGGHTLLWVPLEYRHKRCLYVGERSACFTDEEDNVVAFCFASDLSHLVPQWRLPDEESSRNLKNDIWGAYYGNSRRW